MEGGVSDSFPGQKGQVAARHYDGLGAAEVTAQGESFFEACLRLAEGYDPETNYSLVLAAVMEHVLGRTADPHALS